MEFTQEDVTQNMGLVYMTARRMTHLVNGIMEFQDLISEGVVGLTLALKNFDPKKGFKFSTYAEYYIRGYMLQGHRRLFKEHWNARYSGICSTTVSIFNSGSGNESAGRSPTELMPAVEEHRGQTSKSAIESANFRLVLERAWPMLTEKQKEVLLLMLGGLNQIEIAPLLGVTRQAIGIRYAGALNRLRSHFVGQKEAA
jgi:RNA polymerase sigma factor (sigma-70 family)